MSSKTKKYIIVVFLTLLIWASAYLALEDTTDQVITLGIAQRNPSLFVSFVNRTNPFNVNVKFKGSAAKISDFEGWVDAPEPGLQDKLTFYFDAEEEGKTEEKIYPLEILDFLQGSDKIKSYGLTVESCLPKSVDVEVRKLEKQPVSVECRDENGVLLTHESIDPPTVDMYVPSEWTENKRKATVVLSPALIVEAREGSVEATPYIVLGGDNRSAGEMVKITLSPTNLLPQTGQLRTIKYLISAEMMEIYIPVLLNEAELTEVTSFSATNEAWQAYLATNPKLIIEVREEDFESDNPDKQIIRQVKYNFPEEYVRNKEIELVEDPRDAKFQLIPISPSAGGS